MNEIIENLVEWYVDEHINAENPCEEHANGDVVILSKYDLGRQIILENFDEDSDIHIDKIYDLVEEYLNDIVCGVFNGAIEYCCNNNLNIHM